jgi:hypothetical protein
MAGQLERIRGKGRRTARQLQAPRPAAISGPAGRLELLPPKIAVGLQDLRNEIQQARRDIEGALQVDGPPEAVAATNARCKNIGEAARKLEDRLRHHYRLGAYQSTSRVRSQT